jgi:dolichyl-phosphate-mannose--protein O-mannosyl transferase
MAFYRLGNFDAPTSGYTVTMENPTIILDFGETVVIDSISSFIGPFYFIFDAYILDEESGEWVLLEKYGSVAWLFGWHWHDFINEFRYLRFESKTFADSTIREMVFLNNLYQVIVPVNADEYPGLFDEQELYHPYHSYTYYNGAMWDEVFYGSAAYDYIHGLPSYGTGHPPLGTIIMTIGIRLFGMTPFGWRFMSAVFGILMVPLMYAFGRALFGNRLAATAVTVLLAFDCMHFTLSRIGTIDNFAAFFILLMYYLFLRYLQLDRERSVAGLVSGDEAEDGRAAVLGNVTIARLSFPRSYIYLALGGIVMGLAVTTKWTGVFAGLGLGAMFLFYIIKYRPPQIKRFITFCAVFFLAVPLFIYIMSYRHVQFIPELVSAESGWLATFFVNAAEILGYHTTRSTEHAYGSAFYEWPVIWQPLLYTSDPLDFTFLSSVNLMGNPAIWWAGIPCLLFCLYRAVARRDKRAGFIVVAYLAQYLPWFFVGRLTFIYHYYPSVLFLILAVGYVLDMVARKWAWGRTAVYGYLAVAVAVFVIFYPVISGTPATHLYESGLRWLPKWELGL